MSGKARHAHWLAGIALLVVGAGCTVEAQEVTLDDAQVEDLVRRSYPYVAMYNVNNKFALSQGGWNTVRADTHLKDHTLSDIARPNNDTLYVGCLLDLRKDAVVLELPAFDSDYVSLMITGYDHYVSVTRSTRQGDFRAPERLLVHSARTQGYDGAPVEGVDGTFEATGDFVSAVLRVMPHANEPERYARIVDQMQSVRLTTLSELRGGEAPELGDVDFPPVGKTDLDVFEHNLLPVMQFVFDHTTFDPDDGIDRGLLDAYAPLGVVPGAGLAAEGLAEVDGARLRHAAERLSAEVLARMADPRQATADMLGLFRPKGHMTVDLLLVQSVIGPLGLPAVEAVYPPVTSADGEPLNALHDYVVRMGPDELPPAGAFWSLTLYDLENGFFVPNERRKYSVGVNSGMRLDEQGGIAIHVAAEPPAGVPPENWLPIVRADEDLSLTLRIYVPDLERMKTWKPPVAERR